MAFLGSTMITGVTGTFERGCLGYWNGEYLLLDRTPAKPRLIRVSAMTPEGSAVPNLTVGDVVELPPSDAYYGIGASNGSVVVLQSKGVLCEDGNIAIAELLTIDISSGVVLSEQEILNRELVSLTGGLCRKNSQWLILGETDTTNFYEIHDDNSTTKLALFAPSIMNRSALTYDPSNEGVFVLNGSNEALAFNHEWLTPEAADDITLETSNADAVGIVWTSSLIAVLNANPLSIFWYGEAGSTTQDIPVVSMGDRRQLKRLTRGSNLVFRIGGITFKAIIGHTISRIPNPGGTPSIIEVEETRITPEYVLDGVRAGMTISQGSSEYKIKGVYSINNDYQQSFLCENG